MAIKTSKMPASWSYKGEVEQLRTDAFASLSRMLERAVAETGVNFQIHDALRSLAEQVALFRANYVRVSRGRRNKTDRSYAGSIWAKKSSGVPVASPDYDGGSVAKHRQGLAIDIHPGAIQAWMRANGRRFGWTWTTGKRVGEAWHFEYEPALDTYKAEGVLDHAWVQRVVGAAVDGKIGTGTVGKIKAWQKAHGLEADGKVGPATKAAMKKASSGKDEAPSAPAGGADEPKPAAPAVVPAAVPGWMPGADRSLTWSGNAHKAAVRKIVLHTTEGGSLPNYQSGGVAPHFTVFPDGRIYQHFPTTQSAKALEHPAGTVETNNGGCIQIEFIGSCDRAYAAKNGLFFTEDAQDVDLAGLASVLAWVSAAHDIPLTADGLTWPTTNAAYTSAPQRMSDSEWLAYTGVCGHTHVPHNSHWDPGAFPVARLLELAGGAAPAAPSTPTTPTTGGDMPTGKALLMALIAAPDFPLLRTDGHLCYYGPKTGPKESVSGHQANTLNPGDVGSSGSTGLKAWQKRMNARGYSLTVDGKYGDKTATAAKNLQKLAGITQDQLIGPDCWHAAYLLPRQ